MRLVEPGGEIWGRIAAIGDVAGVAAVRARARREGWDVPFQGFGDALRRADVGFANLECPVGEPADVRPERSPEFWQDAAIVPALVRAGVRVVSLANNHVMDCGPGGLERTLTACRDAGLATIGAGRTLDEARQPARFEIGGRRTIWLAYGSSLGDAAGPASPGIAPLDADLLHADLARWRAEADLLVVSAHWGSMYVDYPPPRVLKLAQLFAEEQVDVVLGHHPHVLQGVRREGRTLVLYSLGDAVFDPLAGELHSDVGRSTRPESGVFTVLLGAEHGVEVTPLRLGADGIPGEPDPEQIRSQLERLREMSAGLDEAERRFATEGASALLRYELQSLGTWVRRGRWDRVLQLLSGVRPRHVPLLLDAVFAKRTRR